MVEATTQKAPLRKPVFINISQLEPGTRINMHLKVESVKIIRERKRYDGGAMNRVAECVVGDQFGCVRMMAYDEQLNTVTEGACITVRNSHANVVKEHCRLEVDRWAKVEPLAPGIKRVESVNLSKNLSDIEYELVLK
jgi:replication factor A1